MGVIEMYHNILLTHDPHASSYDHSNQQSLYLVLGHMTLLITTPLSGQYLHMKCMSCGLLIQSARQVNSSHLAYQQEVSTHILSCSTCTVEGIVYTSN